MLDRRHRLLFGTHAVRASVVHREHGYDPQSVDKAAKVGLPIGSDRLS
jgi:hypothetical protein